MPIFLAFNLKPTVASFSFFELFVNHEPDDGNLLDNPQRTLQGLNNAERKHFVVRPQQREPTPNQLLSTATGITGQVSVVFVWGLLQATSLLSTCLCAHFVWNSFGFPSCIFQFNYNKCISLTSCIVFQGFDPGEDTYQVRNQVLIGSSRLHQLYFIL